MAVTALRTKDILYILDEIATEIIANKEFLTEIDSIGGDGDHGVNLERGFLGVQRQLEQLRDKDLSTILTLVGSTLMSSIGGSAGSLYGALFMKAGNVYRGKEEIMAVDLPIIFQACEDTITSLGRAKPGDKTMLDVLHPTTEAVSNAAGESSDLVYVMDEGAKAARIGLENTKSMIARKGRAMYLGDRTLGHYDAGAASLCLMMESAARSVKKLDSPDKPRAP
jgi:dihydroxyacetone kinase-like protein